MTNELCKDFFKAACKCAGITQTKAIKAVWGKESNNNYWIGNESKTVRGHCIWCARSEAIMQGLVK